MSSDSSQHTNILETDVLVIGSGAAGQAAALAASEAGAKVILLHKGPSATAISTGFLTFWQEKLSAEDLTEAMFKTTGKEICDRALLERYVAEGPKEIGAALKDYDIPHDTVPSGVRISKAQGKSGRDLTGEVLSEEEIEGDTTTIVMEFSSTHGTRLFSKLLHAVGASANIDRIKGTALQLLPDGRGAQALMLNGQIATIHSNAVILATGGTQGLYEFTDSPQILTGDGLSMALEAGATLVDMEFIQFYPMALAEEDKPTVIIYPDFPVTSRIVNDDGEDIIRKHFGETQSLGQLDNWDHLAIIEQLEIADGQRVYFDFSTTTDEDWAKDSLTKTYMEKYVPDYRERLIQITPIMHHTIGGLQIDTNGQTSIPGVYACGEASGGMHGANRHGGTGLGEGVVFGRIAGRHAAVRARDDKTKRAEVSLPPEQAEGENFNALREMTKLRHLNQIALGPLRTPEGLHSLGESLKVLQEEAEKFGWQDHKEYAQLLNYQRSIRLSECMRLSMLQRTESRGVHARSDYTEPDESWRKKQTVSLGTENNFVFEYVAI